jgi:hypothetical protein
MTWSSDDVSEHSTLSSVYIEEGEFFKFFCSRKGPRQVADSAQSFTELSVLLQNP